MSEPIYYVDSSEILEGRLPDLKAAMNELTAFVEANEPQLISYGFFLNESETRMTVVAVHPDSESMELHMKIGGPGFRKFTNLIRLSSISVYGRPSDTVVDQLREKARMLGGATVVVNPPFVSFSRAGR